jgi:hypothetical protein
MVALLLDRIVPAAPMTRADRVATLEEAKTQFQKSWDPWKAWVASEDRTHQLQAEVELWRDRAGSAEQWLRIIQKEIEEKLIAQSSSRAEQASLH